MAKDTSKGSKKAGGGSVTSVVTPDGDTIDLSATPLVYGKNDSVITAAARAKLERFEARRASSKIEYARGCDDSGNAVYPEVKGGKTGVQIPYVMEKRATAISHIHPRGKGEEKMLGGTFSGADTDFFAKTKGLKTFRAKAFEGTYSMSKTANFDASGFQQFGRTVERQTMHKYKTASKQAYADYVNNKITAKQYNSISKKAFNEALIDAHNLFLANQSKYGYEYTLERPV